MKFDPRRLITWLVPPVAIVGLQILISTLNAAGQLPNPIAIHWGVTLRPDRLVSIEEFALTGLIIQFALWVPSLMADLWPKSKLRIKNILTVVFGIVFWLITAIILISIFIQIGASDASTIDFPWLVFAVILISVALVIAFFLSMPEVVVGDSVQVKLRGLNIMSFDPDEIVSASVGAVTAREFFGWGLRLTTRKIGFVPSSGPAVKLELQDGTQVFIRSNGPARVVHLIQELIS